MRVQGAGTAQEGVSGGAMDIVEKEKMGCSLVSKNTGRRGRVWLLGWQQLPAFFHLSVKVQESMCRQRRTSGTSNVADNMCLACTLC